MSLYVLIEGVFFVFFGFPFRGKSGDVNATYSWIPRERVGRESACCEQFGSRRSQKLLDVFERRASHNEAALGRQSLRRHLHRVAQPPRGLVHAGRQGTHHAQTRQVFAGGRAGRLGQALPKGLSPAAQKMDHRAQLFLDRAMASALSYRMLTKLAPAFPL